MKNQYDYGYHDDNQTEFYNVDRRQAIRKRSRKPRYDRIAIALLIVIALISLMIIGVVKVIVGIVGGINDKNDSSSQITEYKEDGIAASGLSKVDNSHAVFLSPSNQWDNEYALSSGESVTEADEMRAVAEVAKSYLEEKGITVYMASEDFDVRDKVAKGNELGVGMYVAIHSNAGDDGEGTECYYNSNVDGSLELAQYVYDNVSELTPTEDRGMKRGIDYELYEANYTEVPSCLVEVEFHDNEDGAYWITQNIDSLGKTIADGIISYYDELPPVSTTSTSETAPSDASSNETTIYDTTEAPNESIKTFDEE